MSITLTTGTDDRARICRALRFAAKRINSAKAPGEVEALERLEKAIRRGVDLIVFEDQ